VKRGALVVLAIAVAGCAGGAPRQPPPAPLPRVIALAPSLTEIAFAIGCGPELVGDTTYDDYPPEARRVPHVADLVHADLERIAALRPTIVLALHDEEREGAPIAARLSIPIAYLPNRRLQDLFADIAGVGAACGKPRQAARLSADLQRRIRAAAAAAARSASHPSVLYLVGLPGFVAGRDSYLNDVIKLAGGTNAAGGIDAPYPNLNAEAIVAADPDFVVASNSFAFDQDVRGRPPWDALRAVRAGRVLRPPNDSWLERDGPRLIDGLEWLERAIHQARGK